MIESIESINKANPVPSIVVSLNAIVVSPVTLLNSLLAIEVPNVTRSLKLLAANAVTLVKLTATEVAAFIVFKSEAVADVASLAVIVILIAFPAFNDFSVLIVSPVIAPETVHDVKSSSKFAL